MRQRCLCCNRCRGFAITGGFRTKLYKEAAGIPVNLQRFDEQIIEKEPAFAPGLYSWRMRMHWELNPQMKKSLKI